MPTNPVVPVFGLLLLPKLLSLPMLEEWLPLAVSAPCKPFHRYSNDIILPYSALISRNLNFADSCLQSLNFVDPARYGRALVDVGSISLNNFRGIRCIRENSEN